MSWSEKYLNACHETQKGNYVRYQEFNLNSIYNVNDTFDTSIALDKYENVPISTTDCFMGDNGILYPSDTDVQNVTMYVSQCFLSANYGTGTSVTQWGYKGNTKYQVTGVGLWYGSLPVNQYCTRLIGFKVRDLRTNTIRNLTFNDLLEPSENYSVSYTTSQNFGTYVKDGSTINSDAITVIPSVTFVNDNIFATSNANNFTHHMSTTWKISERRSESSSDTTAMCVKTLTDTQKMVFFSKKGEEHNGTVVYKSEYGVFISSVEGDYQTIIFEPTLKFFVNMLQSTGSYYTIESMSGTWTEDRFKNDSNILLGELDNTGKPKRKWLTAIERQSSTSPNLNNDWENKTNTYNADKDIPDGDSIVPVHTRYLNELTGFIKYYKMTKEDLNLFLNACESAGNALTGFEYMPYITGILQYPFNVSDYIITGVNKEHIKINGVTLDGDYNGHTGFSAEGMKLEGFTVPKKLIGTTTINRYYNNFLDYAPYTTMELYIPLCNYVTLPTECMGNNIEVYLISDIVSGSCKGVVYCQGIPVAETTGSLGQPIAITGTETGLKRQSIVNNALGLTSASVGLLAGAVTGNPVSIASSGISAVGAVTQAIASANNSYTRVTGKTGTCSDFFDSSNCYLKITRPVVNLPSNYGHTVGYICNKEAQLSTCKGFTTIHNPDLTGITCDYSEAQEIKNLLTSGVIIK